MDKAERIAKIHEMLLADKDASKKILKGVKLTVDYGEFDVTFTAGRLSRAVEDRTEQDGFRDLMGEIKTASGHTFHAIIHLCVDDSGEHYGSTVFGLNPATGSWNAYTQGTDEFDAWVRGIERQVTGMKFFPYRYKYRDTNIRYLDHHVDERTGWSHSADRTYR